MTVAYELVNRPWRARAILRAWRIFKIRTRLDGDEHAAWSRSLLR